MEVIYADSVFIIDLVIDYLLCLVSGRICGLCLKRLRYLAAAVLGAAYSVAVLLPDGAFLSGPLMKLGCCLFMGLIAYGGEAHPLRCTAVFFGVSALFGGALWAVCLASGTDSLSLDPKVLLLSFALCYAGVDLLFRRRADAGAVKRVEVVISFLGREARFMALPDTGNSLSDPITGCRVMVVSPHALAAVFKGNEGIFRCSDPVAVMEAAGTIPELRGRLRLIPYSAVGTGGMLPVFRPDRISIDGKEEKGLLAAVSPSAVGDGYEAVV